MFRFTFISISVFILPWFKHPKVLGCDGFEKCCVGYMWNETLQNCTKCSIGFTGIRCEEQCPFPTYGEICQKECNCTRDLCDFSTGCKPNRTLVTDTISTLTKFIDFSGPTIPTDLGLSSNNRHTGTQNSSQSIYNSIFFHPLVLSLFLFNVIFVIIILIFIFLFSRTLYCKTRQSNICEKEIKQISSKKIDYQENVENESNNCLLHSAFSSGLTSTLLKSNTNCQFDSRNPSENAEYTETKSVYTEMTATSLSSRGDSLQLQRQPCQSVDDHVYSATDTLWFDSETDTKEFLNE